MKKQIQKNDGFMNWRQGFLNVEILPPTLLRFARSECKAHRALILRRLPYLQSKNFDLGWKVFHAAMEEPTGLWKHAESCLYYAYREHFDIVETILNKMYNEAQEEELETWGRISALASLSGLIEQSVLFDNLKAKDSSKAWKGTASVWTHPENIKQFKDHCFTGIEFGLKENIPHAIAVANKMSGLFREDNIILFIPIDIIQLYLNILEKIPKDENRDLFGIDEWLNIMSQHDPEYALNASELFLDFINKLGLTLYDYKDNFPQLITRLFAEAEEKEEVDNGVMLQRVVSLQDTLLAKGISNINDWLKAAERP